MKPFAIAVVHDQLIEASMAQCLGVVIQAYPEALERVIWQPGSVGNFDSSRNWAVRHFLGGEADIMVMIDSDMVFRPADIEALLDQTTEEQPVVSGLYFVGSQPPRPCIAMNQDYSMTALTEYTPGEIIEADGFGHGFVAIHKSLLWEMEAEFDDRDQPWYTQSAVTWGGRAWEADYGFNFRAHYLGYKTLVDTNIVVGHVKPRVLDDKEFWKRKSEIFEVEL